MSTERVSSTWAEFGRELRAARLQAGLSIDQLAGAISASPSLVSKMERGVRSTSRTAAETLDTELGADGALLSAWGQALKRAALPNWAAQVSKSEERSTSLQIFSPIAITGLLQIPEYSSELYRDTEPDMEDEQIKTLVASRSERISRLSGCDITCLMDESVLRRPVGGPEVMRHQLDSLLGVTGVRILVLPATAKTAAWSVGGFRIIGFSDRAPVAAADGPTGESLISEPAEVKRLAAIWSDLVSWACDPLQTAELIKRIRDAH
ncbi:helix-turn-helix domain-containing protein [Nocardiopsis sp. CNT-189]|uniref:helix-turn-helix domain-containing protein n=1 Tax=Nocardiopsis oceanisediminis TaxID=2816862 RepID=UPI003B360CBB